VLLVGWQLGVWLGVTDILGPLSATQDNVLVADSVLVSAPFLCNFASASATRHTGEKLIVRNIEFCLSSRPRSFCVEHIVDVLLGARGTAGALGNPALLAGAGAGGRPGAAVYCTLSPWCLGVRAARCEGNREAESLGPMCSRIRIFSGDPQEAL
jgi:hypothetical protein